MPTGNLLLWLCWALFGSYLVWVLLRIYLPNLRTVPEPMPQVKPPPPAWLFCLEGPALDRRVQWFPLRAGGQTVLGRLPRSDTPATAFVYLTAEDIAADHARLTFDPASGRYRVERLAAGPVLHNDETVPTGSSVELTDGDTLDLGRLSRFRFSLSGPENLS